MMLFKKVDNLVMVEKKKKKKKPVKTRPGNLNQIMSLASSRGRFSNFTLTVFSIKR